MSILDIDSKPITEEFLKSKGFIKHNEIFVHKILSGIFIYPSNYPINLRGYQPNTAMILCYSTAEGFESIYVDDVYTERDVEMVLDMWKQKHKYKL